MDYRRFGKTELNLSTLSLGTMRSLGDRDSFRQVVRAAIAAGINHIETARGYGDSERLLGQVLGELGATARSQLVITTKLLPTPDAATLAQQFQESLARLQVERIDCLALHGINTPEHLAWIQAPHGCMAAVREAQRAGSLGHVGFSTHGSQAVIRAAIATDQFAFINLHYYYFFQHHHPLLALAQERDMGVFIISPGDKGGQLYTPPDTLRRLCAPYHPLLLTYRWLLQDARVTTLSIGPSTPEELTLPLAVQDSPLTPGEQEALDRLAAHGAHTLATDQCHQCYRCLPCPEAIPIPEILRLRNLAVAYDMTAYGQYRYQMLENAGHWFPGRRGDRCTDCGDCLPRCPVNLPIPALLRDTHQRLQGSPRRRLWGD